MKIWLRSRAGPPFVESRPRAPRRHSFLFLKVFTLIEIFWGKPLSFVVSPEGDIQVFSTAEQVRYWLRKKWPISDEARDQALQHVEAAMDCLMPVGTARRAFITAARSAGFVPENLVWQTGRGAAA